MAFKKNEDSKYRKNDRANITLTQTLVISLFRSVYTPIYF